MKKLSKSPSIPKFHSLSAVADCLGLSQRSVRRLIDDGALVAHKIGGAVRISDNDLQQLIARSRQKYELED